MSLAKLVKEIEENVGTFSSYETTVGAGQDIPFNKKPASQFLEAVIQDTIDLSEILTKPVIPLKRKGNTAVELQGNNSFDSMATGSQ